jgi:hypothetical protein
VASLLHGCRGLDPLGQLRQLAGKVQAFEWMLGLPTNLRHQQIRSLEAQTEIARLTSE